MANEKKSGGMGLASVLLVVFLVLKLTGLITWSWWWVLSPIWISAIIIALCIATLVAVKLCED